MKQPYREHVRLTRYLTLGFFLFLAIPCSVSLAQVVTPITSSGLNTTVSAPITLPSGQTQFNITGGTRPGGGANLFHSFGSFDIPSNNIANFLNNSGLATSNILGRVTGGNVSNIFGTIQTTGFGNANLFLINPAGFLFGPNATINVGGMMTFTSADYLRLSDNVRFNAIPRTAPDLLLSAAPVAAFGFLGSNPGAITVQGSHLSVAEGTGISLVGGNITVQAGALSAPSGQINLVSVDTPRSPVRGGEINVSDFSSSSTQGFRSLGTIALLDGTSVTTSGINSSSGAVTHNNGGRVVVRSGQLIVSNTSIRADGVQGSSPGSNGGRIEVHAGTVTLDQAALSAKGAAAGNGGQISFMDLNSLNSTQSSLTVRTGTSNTLNPEGLISIGSLTTESIALTDTYFGSDGIGISPGPVWPFFIGDSGNITLTARNLSINGGHFLLTSEIRTPGGSITMNADQVAIRTGITGGSIDGGAGGTITIQGLQSTETSPTKAGSVSIGGSITLHSVSGGGGRIVVRANALALNGSRFRIEAAEGAGGTINLADVGTLTSMSSNLSTYGRAAANSIILGSATTRGIDLQDTGIFTTFNNPDSNINIRASTVNISGGRIIGSPDNQITINGGDVTFTNGALISSSGLFPGSGTAGTVTIAATGRFQSTGSTISATSAQGVGGAIFITAGNVLSVEGSTVTADSTAGGNAGTIELTAGKNLTVDNSIVSANSTGAGNAGTVELTASKNLRVDNSIVSANSTGAGNAGTVELTASKNLRVDNSIVSANSTGAGNAGTVELTAGKNLMVGNSTVLANSEGTGSVGAIELTAGNRIILQESVVTPAPTLVSE
ncbi:MAG: filamentous hemagglutinin N-terminal domain-containing protein [Nitrospira sp.]|nr:filamentous hemagglutinin N-terminal domain-containing protein [Nitrospira sp.]